MSFFTASDGVVVPNAVLDEMKANGGSFEARLAGLYIVADETNRRRLVEAFEFEFKRARARLPAPKGD